MQDTLRAGGANWTVENAIERVSPTRCRVQSSFKRGEIAFAIEFEGDSTAGPDLQAELMQAYGHVFSELSTFCTWTALQRRQSSDSAVFPLP